MYSDESIKLKYVLFIIVFGTMMCLYVNFKMLGFSFGMCECEWEDGYVVSVAFLPQCHAQFLFQLVAANTTMCGFAS